MKATSPEERPRSRFSRWFPRVVGAMTVLSTLAFGALFVLVHNLDTPWIKRHVQELLLTSTGVDVDYGKVDVSLFSGVDIDGIVARTPGPFHVFAPELARIDHVRARWSASTLVNPRPSMGEVDVQGATLTVVLDENGVSSLDAIHRAPSPPTPLSALSRELIDESSPVRLLHLRDATLNLIRIRGGNVVERDTLSGLSLDADCVHTGSGRLAVNLGSRTEPLVLRLERWREGEAAGKATVRASFVVTATPADAAVSLDLRVVEQDLAPDVHLDDLAHLELQAEFDAARRKSEVSLTDAHFGGGALTAEARIEMPDEGLPIVRHANGDLDAAGLLRLLPAGLVPVRLARGHLHYRIDELAVGAPATSASAAIDADVGDAVISLAEGSIALPSARLSLRAQPVDKGFHIEGDALLGAVHQQGNGSRTDGDDLALKWVFERSESGAWSGQSALHFATIEQKSSSSATARDGKVELRVRDLAIKDFHSPLAARGDLSLDATIQSLESRSTLRTTVSAMKLRAHLPLTGAAPVALDAALDASRLVVARPNGQVMSDTPGHLTLTLNVVAPDLDHPEHSNGDAHLGLSAGALEARLDAVKKDDWVDIDMTAKASALGALRRLASGDFAQRVPWDKMACEIHAHGRVDHFHQAEPLYHQESELRLTGAAIDAVRVPNLALELRSDGTAMKQEGELTLDARSVVVDGTALADDRLKVSLALDRSERSLHLKVTNQGALQSELAATFGFDPTDRAVTYDIAGRLAELGSIAPLLAHVRGLAHFDFGKLALRLRSRGRIVGLISSINRQGDIAVSSDPGRTAGGRGSAEIEMTNFRWSESDRAFTVPAVTLRTSFHGQGERRGVESNFTAESMEIGIGRRHVTITGLHDQTAATWTGGFGDGTFELSQRSSIRAVRQNFLAMYPIGDVTSNLTARIDAEGVFKIAALQVENPAGGTSVSLSGGIDLSADQRRMSFRTSLKQDLARASSRPERFAGSGKAAIDLAVESPNFRVFHSRATFALEGATIRLPRSGLVVENADGEVPVVSDVVYGQRGIELLRGALLNPYAVLRFADQHPLLTHRSFLSIGRVTTPLLSIAPFAANLGVEQNVISLSQLEMGVRGGSVTGNGILDWDGLKTKLQADLHANGVQSSHGEPFDGNAALVIDMGDRSIEGRADILRIGRRHLFDLLDLQDPHRADAGMNRIRSALALGYPERVRIAFKHGFASAGVSFGGLAGLVSVDDLRGIPIGPMMERVVRSFKLEEEEQ